jgi:hypothetical protein
MDKEELKKFIEQVIEEKMFNFFKIDKNIFDKHTQILNGYNIQLGKGVGTKIGTEGGATGQKLGFFGTTPVVQQPAIVDASATADINGTDTVNRAVLVTVLDNHKTTINKIIDNLENLGLQINSD